ncbi:MAG: HD domain-containing protein [Candidatus Woesearchaeota archaeon]
MGGLWVPDEGFVWSRDEDFLSEVYPSPLEGVGVDEVYKALGLAKELHAGQVRRGNGEPYYLHPLGVARVLHGYGFRDPPTLCAALLHDTAEDSKEHKHSPEDLLDLVERDFSSGVAGAVALLSKNVGLKWNQVEPDAGEYIARLAQAYDPRVRVVKLADLGVNTLDPHNLSSQGLLEKVTMGINYREWGADVSRKIQGKRKWACHRGWEGAKPWALAYFIDENLDAYRRQFDF